MAKADTPTDTSLSTDELEHEVKRLKLSLDITREFVATTDMKKLMSVIFTRVVETLPAEAGSLWMVDWKTRQNVCHLAEGPAKDKVVGLRLPAGKGIVGAVIQSRKADAVLDCSKDPRFAAEVDKKTGFETRSMVTAPLVVGKHAYGAIQVINKRGSNDGFFNDDDLEMVKDLGISAGVSIKNARLLESESRVKEMGKLMTISNEIASSLDLDQVLATVVNMSGELVDMTNAAVALYDEDKERLFLAALSGEEEVDPDDEAQQALLELMKKVMEMDRVVHLTDREAYRKQQKGKVNDWLRYLDEAEMVSSWSAPLKDGEGTLGVLWLESETSRFAAGSKADLLTILCSQTTVALRNASLYQTVPFADVIGNVADKGRRMVAAWRKWAWVTLGVLILAACAHYLPWCRTIKGDCVVEAHLGFGVFLPIEGRVADILVKEGDLVKAGGLVAVVEGEPLRMVLVEARSKLDILERQIIEARATGKAASLRRLLIEREAQRAVAQKAATDMKKLQVRAPRDGIVLTPRTKELIGRAMPMGAEILRMANPADLKVVIDVPQEDVLDIQRGQAVAGVLRSLPGEKFHGTVAHVGIGYEVPLEAVNQDGVAPIGPADAFAVEVEVRETPVPLKPGMTGKARIKTPDVSLLMRIGRRIRNFFAFTFGF